jgi:glutaredoxin
MFKLYSQSNCPNCEELKKYLKMENISFEETDINTDHLAKTFMIINDLETTPILIFNNNILSGELDDIKKGIAGYSL